MATGRGRERRVVGYHGCSPAVAERLVNGEPFDKGRKTHHWAGSGVYFWEEDPDRAVEWSKRRNGAPAVVGVEIRLGCCLDLTTQSGARFLKAAEPAFRATMAKAGRKPPENEALSSDPPGFKTLRYLDCAVIDFACNELATAAKAGMPMPRGFPAPIDTVRCAYEQGEKLYAGAELLDVTHVEVAVRNLDAILQVWREV